MKQVSTWMISIFFCLYGAKLCAHSYDYSMDKRLPVYKMYLQFQLKTQLEYQFEKNLQKNLSLFHKSYGLHAAFIEKIKQALICAHKMSLAHQPILVAIDYSLPTNQKRLWVFDLKKNKLLFHTYVSHGIRSGELTTDYFSNVYNSKASSMGVFLTKQSYYGRHGLSLRLEGIEPGFNHQAMNRAIVMHGAWYMEEKFVQNYGRNGRSWGCPAIPNSLVHSLIPIIKNNALMIAYYPDDVWSSRSSFLNCNQLCSKPLLPAALASKKPMMDARDDFMYSEQNKNFKRDKSESIVGICVSGYRSIFHKKPPLNRMLRRPINGTEFIALNQTELYQVLTKHPQAFFATPHQAQVRFILQKVLNKKGHWVTEFDLLDLTPIDYKITSNDKKELIVYFKKHTPVTLKSSDQFVRWMGV